MRKLIATTLLAAGLLSACAPSPAASDTTELQNQVTTLQGQVTALQTQVAELSAAPAEEEHMDEASAFDVAVAQYVLNTAGFHGMAESIAESETIDPAYGGAVNRVRTIFANTTWPEELQEEETAFVALLDEFSAKIEADDGAGAVEISDQVHEAQHAFSASIDAWLGVADEHGHGN
jgi:hypothetical protein